MKKVLLIIVLFLLFPIISYAETYVAIDLKIDLDDKEWYVFTRYNMENNKNLDKLGISYDYLNNFMKNNYVYVDALNINNNIELFVLAKKTDLKYNFHNFSNKHLKVIAEEMTKQMNTDDYDIYKANKYKYLHFDYSDKQNKIGIDNKS